MQGCGTANCFAAYSLTMMLLNGRRSAGGRIECLAETHCHFREKVQCQLSPALNRSSEPLSACDRLPLCPLITNERSLQRAARFTV